MNDQSLADEPVDQPAAEPEPARPPDADAPPAPDADAPPAAGADPPTMAGAADPPLNRHKLTEERQIHSAASANFFGEASIGAFIFNAFDPNAFAGDHLYRRGEKRRATWEEDVDTAEVERIGFVFERPPTYGPAYACLQENRLVILRGPAGSGKSAAVIYLAREIHLGGVAAMRALSAEADLRALRVERDTVYLIDGYLDERARQVADHVWREITGSLRANNCYLVICASDNTIFGHGAAPYVCPWAAPADGALILRKHLRRAEVEDDEIDQLLARPEVATVLAQRPSPQQIARLARRLETHLDGGGPPLAETLRDFTGMDEAAIADWFRGAKTDEERALWLALVVFNGSPFRLAQEAGRLLARRIATAFPPRRRPTRPRRPGVERRRPTPGLRP